MTFRHFMSWKPLFYDALLPTLRALGPDRGDAILSGLGHFLGSTWPARRRELEEPLRRIRDYFAADWNLEETRKQLEVNVLRFLARDCLLDGGTDEEFFARFEVDGEDNLKAALARGRGVILLGCHHGSFLPGLHWIYRRQYPLRMLVQRPQHCSRLVNAHYDVSDGPHPQPGFFVKRRIEPEEATKRIFRTRAALRDNLIVYMKGDVPWTGPNTRPGAFLGFERSFQSLWAEFAALFRAPAVPFFCGHLPRGRYHVTFDPAINVARGDEDEAVRLFLRRLEQCIAAHPADAVAHLLWPCYGDPALITDRESRREQPKHTADALAA